MVKTCWSLFSYESFCNFLKFCHFNLKIWWSTTHCKPLKIFIMGVSVKVSLHSAFILILKNLNIFSPFCRIFGEFFCIFYNFVAPIWNFYGGTPPTVNHFKFLCWGVSSKFMMGVPPTIPISGLRCTYMLLMTHAVCAYNGIHCTCVSWPTLYMCIMPYNVCAYNGLSCTSY